MEVLGANAHVRQGSAGAVLSGRIERLHRSALILTFGGGTNEVQRDIIAAVGLGAAPSPPLGESLMLREKHGLHPKRRSAGELAALTRKILADRVTQEGGCARSKGAAATGSTRRCGLTWPVPGVLAAALPQAGMPAG